MDAIVVPEFDVNKAAAAMRGAGNKRTRRPLLRGIE
jgi:hypothetical protein